MKNFKLLLKNSMKSLWNSRVLVGQFTTLTTIATVVISSVSLGNFSLRNSMAKVNKESNANGFSVENRAVEDFANYNIVFNSQKLVNSIDDLKPSDATFDTKVYNPLVFIANPDTTSVKELSVNNGTPYPIYGFFQKYSNDGKYTTSYLSKQWNNIAFSKMDESLSIIVQLIQDKAYQNRLWDIFTLYNDILPPSPSQVESSKYEIFFNENIYSFNPWSLFIDQTDNEMKVNDFGLVKVENFNSEDDVNTNITFNHGVFDSLYSYVVGTNLTFLDEALMSNYKDEMSKSNNDVKLSTNWNNIFSNNWKQPSSTISFKDNNDFVNLMKQLDETQYQIYFDNWYTDNYWQFLNVMTENIKNNFMQQTKSLELNYQIDTSSSTGLSKFISEIYTDKNNKYYSQKDQIFNSEDSKYFSGSLKIPLIPFITVLPSNKNLDAEATRIWASNFNNLSDDSQSIINVQGVESILRDTFNKLSEKSNKFFKQLLDSNNVSTDIRNDYYSEYNLEYFLKNEKGFNFSKSSNFTLTDSDSNSFILTKSKYYSESKVNNIVMYEGRSLIDNKINSDYLKIDNIFEIYSNWQNVLSATSPPTGFSSLEEYQKDYFKNDNNFFIIMNLLAQSKLNTNDSIIEEFNNYISQVINIKLFNENFSKWKTTTLNFIQNYLLVLISWNGGDII